MPSIHRLFNQFPHAGRDDLDRFQRSILPGDFRLAQGMATGSEENFLNSEPLDLFYDRPVRSLFRRFTVEVFVVRLRFGAGMVDNAIPMIRRGTRSTVLNVPAISWRSVEQIPN